MDDRKWCVYIHTNEINGKSYVGITSQSPEKRWMNGYGYNCKLPFGRAVRKYGWDNFEHIVIMDNLTEEDAKFLEVYLIDTLDTMNPLWGYNMTKGGEGVTGFHHTDEARALMSKAKSGENHPRYGKHLPEETRKKIGLAHVGNKYALGIIRSSETKEKMSRSKWKPVLMMKDGEIVRTFGSAKEAQEKTGISRKNISLCCLNQRKHAGGYSWKFA